MTTTTELTLIEISTEALADVSGGWAREGLRNAGERLGGAIDDTGNALIAAGQYAGQQIAAGARAVGQAAVATSNAVRTGVANDLDAVGRGFQAVGNWVRPGR